MPRHSKLQLQVLNLYKQFLRVSTEKPGTSDHIRSQFKQNAQIPKTDIMKIEYMLRRGKRQLELLKSSSVTRMAIFESGKK